MSSASSQNSVAWPSSRDFVEAIQHPETSFRDPDMRDAEPALDRLGMPVVSSGQFAYVFKLKQSSGESVAVRCFRGFIGDRVQRYTAIDSHLNRSTVSSLASFDFDDQGILVNGSRYPAVVMEWVSGPTLDSYIDSTLGKKDVLLFIAEEWLKVVQSLKQAHIAHGDLQHGNIIVQDGRIRLVDLDGMFVPAMIGWKACELGHRHYQHPRRSANSFGESLDNFSAIVIYLSLISLAHAPELWPRYHDENLIFSQSDFLDPSKSVLFSEVRKISSDTRALADLLASSALKDIGSVPYLLDIVSGKPSKLPEWMRASPPGIAVQGKTREASAPIQNIPGAAPVRVPPGVPVTPVRFAAQRSQILRLQRGIVARTAIKFSLALSVGGVFLAGVWYPILMALYKGLGLIADTAEPLSLFTYLSVCTVLGISLAISAERRKLLLTMSQVANPHIATPINAGAQTARSPRWTGQPIPPSPLQTQSSPAIVGSRIRLIYHSAACDWARKISWRNRVSFPSASAAQAAGYRRCRVCLP